MAVRKIILYPEINHLNGIQPLGCYGLKQAEACIPSFRTASIKASVKPNKLKP